MAGQLCSIYTQLNNEFFIPAAVIGALLGVAWFAVAYAASGFFPELSGRMRGVPKNVLIGLLTFTVGPWLISAIARAAGLAFTGC